MRGTRRGRIARGTQAHLGCRHFTIDVEEIDQTRTLLLPLTLSSPTYTLRDIYYLGVGFACIRAQPLTFATSSRRPRRSPATPSDVAERVTPGRRLRRCVPPAGRLGTLGRPP